MVVIPGSYGPKSPDYLRFGPDRYGTWLIDVDDDSFSAAECVFEVFSADNTPLWTRFLAAINGNRVYAGGYFRFRRLERLVTDPETDAEAWVDVPEDLIVAVSRDGASRAVQFVPSEA